MFYHAVEKIPSTALVLATEEPSQEERELAQERQVAKSHHRQEMASDQRSRSVVWELVSKADQD